jgi:hypothetical protein
MRERHLSSVKVNEPVSGPNPERYTLGTPPARQLFTRENRPRICRNEGPTIARSRLDSPAASSPSFDDPHFPDAA